MTMTTSAPTLDRIEHQRRLRNIVKQLVIELGYLEHCLAAGRQDVHLRMAASELDTAIACLNDHLTSC